MEISGIDYIFSTSKSGSELFRDFERDLTSIWPDFCRDIDSIWDIDHAYYAKDPEMSLRFCEDSYFLDEASGEGPFLLVYGTPSGQGLTQVTLVLPEFREKSAFCEEIYRIAQRACNGSNGANGSNAKTADSGPNVC